MDKKETLKAIIDWQRNIRVQPLVCPEHREVKLEGCFGESDNVVLICPECGYTQDYIPLRVLDKYKAKNMREEL